MFAAPVPQNAQLSLEREACVVNLQPDASLGEVVVSGTLKPVAKSESPVPIDIYTPNFFRQAASTSLFDGLRMANGVRPQITCNVCATGDIRINGLDGPYTMVLIDGMPIVSALSTVYGLQGIPAALIERVEVVKGPASTPYGSEALAGVINIITRDPQCAPVFSADIQTNTYGEWNADAGMRFRAGKAFGLLSGNLSHLGRQWDVNDDGFTDVPTLTRYSAFGKLQWQRDRNRLAALSARYLSEERFGGQPNWTPEFYGSDSIYGEKISTRRLELLGAYQLPVAERVIAYGSYNVHRQYSAYGDMLYNGLQHVGFGQLVWDRRIGQRHETMLGAAMRFTWYDDSTPATTTADGLNNRPDAVFLPGVFAQDDIRLSDAHRLLLGARLDWHPVHGPVFSPRANWKWRINEYHTLRLSAGNGFRVANVFTEDHAALTGARRVVFAEALRPEHSWNANLNWTATLLTGFGFVGLDATAFYTRFSNRILPDYDTDPNLIIYANLDGYGLTQGLSASANFNWTSGLRANAGFTWLDAWVLDEGARNDLLYTPRLTANWSVSYPLPRWGLTADYTATLTGPMTLPTLPNDFRPERSPWYALHDLRIGRKFKRFEIYTGIKNLFNFLPRDPLMRPFDPFDRLADDPISNPNGYTFDTAYNYAPMIGRRVFAGLVWTGL